MSAAAPWPGSAAVAAPLAWPPAPGAAPAGPAASVVPAGRVSLRRAVPSDVPAVAALIEGYARRGLLLPRSPEQVLRAIRHFHVAVDGSGVVGCAALRVHSPELGEVGALAVAGGYHGLGLGRRLVEAVVADAVALGLRRVIALTLQEGFFHRLGFRTVRVTEFPEKIAADCAGCPRRAACIEIAVVRDLGGDTERG